MKNEYEYTVLCSKSIQKGSEGNMLFAVRSGGADLFDVAYPV